MNDRKQKAEKTVTLSMRVTAAQAEQIRIAAAAAHLNVATYLHRRVTDRPIISTPRLAMLAELIRTLMRLEASHEPVPELLDALRVEIAQLSLVPTEPGEPA
jgi:uncharacterized protein (DUF1778 family)